MSIQDTHQSGERPSLPNPDRYRNPDNDSRGPYLLADLTVHGVRPRLQYDWRGHLPPNGRHWRFTLERAQTEDTDGRIVWPANGGRPRLKRYISEQQEALRNQDDAPGAIVERALRSMLQALAQEIVRSPDYLVHVEWRDLERLLGEVLSGLGFDVLVTRPGRDGGFDLELRCVEAGQPVIYLVEIKHWKAPSRPGSDILERFFEVVMAYGASRGLLVSSSGYSVPALSGRSEIARQLVRLGDADKIVALCQSYVRHRIGAWTPTDALPSILFADTF
ncbi:restriction endonuclease [Methylocystis parvus]|uniref:Restriction endonuclease n=1 Tax=Methylocystis parvus TaxID=134 RepID=A0A6B8M4E4_9HYPH|nr:restriction endonuclease [Methylocystis parvus]QGM97246.1 restriction endonuclease [Methylocystis parvus]WBJ98842.1 restriction endonuclease [Methylocystis parvus OBBP]